MGLNLGSILVFFVHVELVQVTLHIVIFATKG
jgi:hypothetical protein